MTVAECRTDGSDDAILASCSKPEAWGVLGVLDVLVVRSDFHQVTTGGGRGEC